MLELVCDWFVRGSPFRFDPLFCISSGARSSPLENCWRCSCAPRRLPLIIHRCYVLYTNTNNTSLVFLFLCNSKNTHEHGRKRTDVASSSRDHRIQCVSLLRLSWVLQRVIDMLGMEEDDRDPLLLEEHVYVGQCCF